ncbi:sensor histidine kinase [Shumkonia mesophila]|uniref:sensor histidine kinase n=1 Tax=Shumkonia mesophila TaxID=2838854 RepID=UPI0029350DB0|nr:histidine kinase dimerization/phosphoacceptor domain -containing protein [Shumkonia mesophila]
MESELLAKIEQALRKSEERFRRVVEYAPYAILMTNEAGRIDMVNAQAERLFGYDRSELLGQQVEVLVPQPLRGGHSAMRAGFFREPGSRPMGAGRDLFGLRKDGSTFPVEIGLNPIETEEGMVVLAAVIDISDRKREEERIRDSLKEKDLLLGEIHHRVKNNLQIIHSLLSLQTAGVRDEVALGMLRESQNRVLSMALIHRTLYQSNDFAKVDFATFLDSLVPTLIGSYGIDSSRFTVSVDADDARLPINAAVPCGLIVNELISNTLKHGFPQGRGGKIDIRLANGEGGGAVLSVSDDGVGLPDGLDIDNSATLGLQLVTLLADQIGGKLTIQRRDPTRFEIRFPMET